MRLPPFILATSLIAGLGYALTRIDPAPVTPMLLAWKGAPVALLALYAALAPRGGGRLLLVGVMAFSALGDVLINASGAVAGGAAFLLAHAVAIALYSRHRRTPRSNAGVLIAAAIPAVALLLALLTAPHSLAVLGYVVGVSAMAAFAFLSQFRRDRVALGALMFLFSDLLIVSHLGPGSETLMVRLAIWLLYFGGQVLITLGVLAE